MGLNSLKAELNPICHLLALLGAHHILHISRIRVKVAVKDGVEWLYQEQDSGKLRDFVNTEMNPYVL
jgi:hypothetical protein